MRTKRSRDGRLVDRFQKTREEMKAEAQQNRSVIQSSATTQQHQGEEEEGDEDDEDLQVNLLHPGVSYLFKSVLLWRFVHLKKHGLLMVGIILINNLE